MKLVSVENKPFYPEFKYDINIIAGNMETTNKTKEVLLEYIAIKAIPYLKAKDDKLMTETHEIILKLQLYRTDETMKKVFENEISELSDMLNKKEYDRKLCKHWVSDLESKNINMDIKEIAKAHCFVETYRRLRIKYDS